ncbi:MAG: C25 family cysteine peptidase, partial [candidate division WOR-3 bacterium]
MRKIVILFFPVILLAGEYRGKVSLDIEKLKIREIGEYVIVEYPGAYHSGVPGTPSIPLISLQISLPSGSEAEQVEILNLKKTTLRLTKKIYPNQKPVPISKAGEFDFILPDEKIYKSEVYPLEIMNLVGTGNMSGFSIAGLIFSPVIYYPTKDEIEFVTDIEYRITYKEGTPKFIFGNQLEVFSPLVQSVVVNPEMVRLHTPVVKATKNDFVDLVIITSSSFAPHFDTLKKYKEARGVRTEIVPLDYIYNNYTGRDNPEKIRNFIKDYYQNRGLVYVILGGQADHENNQAIVPRRDVFYVRSNAGYYPDEDTIPCDLYYSDLDGTWNADNDNVWGEINDNVDMYPDVLVGRFPVRNLEQLQNMIRKVIQYETNPPAGYLTRIVLPAQLLWSQYPYYGDSINNRIANLTPTPPWEDIKLYQSQGNLNTSNFISAITNGVGFAHYASHGSETSASFFGISNINSMANGNKMGIHNAICCFTGAIDQVPGGDCLAESLVNHRTGGAVATIMNTRYGWGYPPQLGPSERIDSTFYYFIFQDSVWTLGQAHAISLTRWVPTAVAEGTNGVYRWCIYELWIFGDPSLQVWTMEPTPISASYSPVISAGMPTFTVNTDTPNALVSLSKNGYLIGRGVTDNSGQAVIDIQGTLVPSDTVMVNIRAKNRLPHYGNVTVATDNAFVFYVSSNAQETYGNLNGRINPDENFRLFVLLKNYGNAEATDVVATISSNNSNVTITDNTAYYGDIAPGDSTYGSDYFEFTVSASAVDQENIPFTITITSNEGTWSANFSYTVYAPILSYQRVE